ncbi:MAG: hypothetical protein HOV81_00170 [Kofleriaceae bacterium]|nr:hypothetical protein [Kofleriaceae bacterium]
MTWLRRIATVALVLCASRPVAADRRNGLYLEALGKGGLWGLGYDRRLARRVSIGVVGSGFSSEGQRYVSLSPYLGLYLARHGRSAWFADGGAMLVRTWADSPVPEWPGETSSGAAGIISSGYEFRGRLIFRVFVHGVIGKGGALPWVGLGLGWAF